MSKGKEKQPFRVIEELVRGARLVTERKHRNALASGAFPTVPARYRGMLDVLDALVLAYGGHPERLIELAEDSNAKLDNVRETE